MLEEAGAIVRVIDGRTHRLRIREDALRDADDWIDAPARAVGAQAGRGRAVPAASSAEHRDQHTPKGADDERHRFHDLASGAHLRCARGGRVRRMDQPEVLRRWWGPARRGGRRSRRSICASAALPAVDGRPRRRAPARPSRGEYREVRRPERLVYSWSWEEDGQPGHESTVTVEFVERDRAHDRASSSTGPRVGGVTRTSRTGLGRVPGAVRGHGSSPGRRSA